LQCRFFGGAIEYNKKRIQKISFFTIQLAEGGNGAISGLPGLQILQQLGKKVNNGNGQNGHEKES